MPDIFQYQGRAEPVVAGPEVSSPDKWLPTYPVDYVPPGFPDAGAAYGYANRAAVRPDGAAPPPTPTPLPTAGAAKPFVERDPTADQRLRRHTEKVAEVLNSLMGRGELWQPAPHTWTTRGADFVEARVPAATDDSVLGAVPGCVWIDTVGQQAYLCVSAAAGAAVWKQITT